MTSDSSLPDRLKAASPGLGEASGTEIAQRAAELAQIDGRETFTDADLARAAAELAGSTETPRAPLDDESSVAERLVQNGLAEADHDRRVAAADEAEE